MRKPLVLFTGLVTALMLAACGLETPEEVPLKNSSSSKIINKGNFDSFHDYVVKIAPKANLNFVCTGTLIGQFTVLTSAQCVKDLSGKKYSAMIVTITDSMGVIIDEIDSEKTLLHSPIAIDDIALIQLKRSANAMKVASLNVEDFRANQGITLVGYGYPAAGTPDLGARRYGLNKIDLVKSDSFDYSLVGDEGATCIGDSGGPAFGGGCTNSCIIGITRMNSSTGDMCSTNGSGTWTVTSITSTLENWVKNNMLETIHECGPSISDSGFEC